MLRQWEKKKKKEEEEDEEKGVRCCSELRSCVKVEVAVLGSRP